MTNYQITIGYKGVFTVDIKAENESEAKRNALARFEQEKDKMLKKSVSLQDDNYKVDGCLDMDATWNMYDK